MTDNGSGGLRGRGLGVEVDVGQGGIERVRRDVEFVDGVGAEAADVRGQIRRELRQVLGGDLSTRGDQLADHLYHVHRGMKHHQIGQQ